MTPRNLLVLLALSGLLSAQNGFRLGETLGLQEPAGAATSWLEPDGTGFRVALVGEQGDVQLFRQNEAGLRWDRSLDRTEFRRPTALVVHDFDADGAMELAIADADDGSIWHLEEREGAFVLLDRLDSSRGIDHLLLVTRVDGMALVAASSSGRGVDLFQLGSDAHFGLARPLVTWAPTADLISTDLDGDGFVDLVLSHEGESMLSFIWGEREGFSPALPELIPESLRQVSAADLDDDGDLDLLGLNSDGEVLFQIEQDGSRRFRSEELPLRLSAALGFEIIDGSEAREADVLVFGEAGLELERIQSDGDDEARTISSNPITALVGLPSGRTERWLALQSRPAALRILESATPRGGFGAALEDDDGELNNGISQDQNRDQQDEDDSRSPSSGRASSALNSGPRRGGLVPRGPRPGAGLLPIEELVAAPASRAPFVFRAGRRNGFGGEAASRAPENERNLDQGGADRRFLWTFDELPRNVVSARLVLRLAVAAAGHRNDAIHLSPGSNTKRRAWSASLGHLPLMPLERRFSEAKIGEVFCLSLDLSDLPGGTDLLPWLIQERSLSIEIEDDCAIDYLDLEIETAGSSSLVDAARIEHDGLSRSQGARLRLVGVEPGARVLLFAGVDVDEAGTGAAGRAGLRVLGPFLELGKDPVALSFATSPYGQELELRLPPFRDGEGGQRIALQALGVDAEGRPMASSVLITELRP